MRSIFCFHSVFHCKSKNGSTDKESQSFQSYGKDYVVREIPTHRALWKETKIVSWDITDIHITFIQDHMDKEKRLIQLGVVLINELLPKPGSRSPIVSVILTLILLDQVTWLCEMSVGKQLILKYYKLLWPLLACCFFSNEAPWFFRDLIKWIIRKLRFLDGCLCKSSFYLKIWKITYNIFKYITIELCVLLIV